MRTRLAEVLAAYGADPARWPAAERDRLIAHVESTPDLQALLIEAREIDQILASVKAPSVPAGAAARLLAQAGQQKPKATVIPFVRARARPSIWSWGAAAALAASFGLGIFLGTTNFGAHLGDSDVVEIDDPIVLTGVDDAPDLLEDQG
jgi:anti-sigma factor RsiW